MTVQRPVLVVVGDRARARIFDTDTEDQSLREIEDMFNVGFGRHERDTGADRPGRGVSAARGRRTALGDDYSRRRILAARFARSVADRIRAHTGERHYGRVYLVAGPEFIGLLRPCLTSRRAQPPLTKVVKDLTSHSLADIRQHLPERLR